MSEDKYAELEKKVFADYEAKNPKSKQAYQKFATMAIDGVAGSGGFWRPYPLYFTHASGSKIYDVDGNEYIDCLCGSGANILGHCHPEIQETIKREMDRGLWLLNPDLAMECDELLCEVIPCAERLRYRNTGTEVCTAATMTARGYTGKEKIIKFYGVYHGVDPEFLVGWVTRTNDIVSGGVPREMVANTILLPCNDIDAVRQKLDEDNDIAAVITDVIMGIGGIFLPKGNYLRELRKLTEERGVVLIFDEVLTGFRMALGGAQEYFGVTPDLGCFAKGIAGGAKFGTLVGKKEVMEALATVRTAAGMFGAGAKTVFQSGTMNNVTIGIAGAIATLKVLKEKKKQGEYDKLNQRMDKFARDIEKAFRDRRIGCYVHTAGSYFKIHLTDKPTDPDPTYEAVGHLDQKLRYLFVVALMNEGVFMCLPGSGSAFINFAFTDEDMDKMLAAYNTTLDKYNWTEVYES